MFPKSPDGQDRHVPTRQDTPNTEIVILRPERADIGVTAIMVNRITDVTTGPVSGLSSAPDQEAAAGQARTAAEPVENTEACTSKLSASGERNARGDLAAHRCPDCISGPFHVMVGLQLQPEVCGG